MGRRVGNGLVNSITRSRSSVRSSEEGGLKFLVCFVEAKRHDSGLVIVWCEEATTLRASIERVNTDSEDMSVFFLIFSLFLFLYFVVWFDSASMRRRKIYGGSVGGGDFVARNSLSRELLSRSVETRGGALRLQSAVSVPHKISPFNQMFLATVNLPATDNRCWAGVILLLDKPFAGRYLYNTFPSTLYHRLYLLVTPPTG